MKTKILLLVVLNAILCQAQIVPVSSPGLKFWIISSTVENTRAKDLAGNWTRIDQNNDGELQLTEAQNISYFGDFNGQSSDYSCLQSFSNLEELDCQGNGWTIEMNLSNLTHLKKLTLYNNNTTALNISGCVNLEVLSVNHNVLGTLNLSGLSQLTHLECAYNYLTALNLTSTPNLNYLECSNNGLYALSLNNLIGLEFLACGQNSISNLNLSNNLNIKSLRCDANYLNALNLSNQPLLEFLSCGQNSLGTLNLSNCPNLKTLNCMYAQLGSLNTSNLTQLEYLYCNHNFINHLDLTHNTQLKTLWCHNNGFSASPLILDHQPLLETLFCHQNSITALDVSLCPNLTALYCYDNYNLVALNMNNGFDWNPILNFFGANLPQVQEICTSSNSVPAIQGFYNAHAVFPSVTDCSALNTFDPELTTLNFSPNPASTEILFSSNVETVSLFDIHGRLIKNTVIHGTKMDISAIDPGVYLVKMYNEDRVYSSKLIVK